MTHCLPTSSPHRVSMLCAVAASWWRDKGRMYAQMQRRVRDLLHSQPMWQGFGQLPP